MKFKYGWIENSKTGERKHIVTRMTAQNSLRDVILGVIMTSMGVAYLTITAFSNGGQAYEDAESKCFEDLNLLSNKPPETK